MYESAAMWLFLFFMKGSSAAALNGHLPISETYFIVEYVRCKERNVEDLPEAVNYPLQIYETDTGTTETDTT